MEPFRIQLLGDRAGFLGEQLKIEGFSFFSTQQSEDDSVGKRDLLLVDGSTLSLKQAVFLAHRCCNGNPLILIKPDRHLAAAFGLRRSGTVPQGYMQCSLAGFQDKMCQIYDIDIYAGVEDGAVLLGPDRSDTGYRAIFKKNVSRGRLIVLAFDLNRTIYRLTHGRDIVCDSDGDGELRADDGRVVQDSACPTPQVDLLRRMLVRLIEENIDPPMPRSWYFPFKKTGAFCVTHDSDGASSDQISAVNRVDRQHGINATTFMRICDGSIMSWRSFRGLPLDLQLHVVYLYHRHVPSVFRKDQSAEMNKTSVLRIQRNALRVQKRIFDRFSGARCLGVRNHGLLWNKLTDQPVWMSRERIQFDSTLGANREFGYAYGTGLPYFLRDPLTRSSLDVLEFPLHLMDCALVNKFGYPPTDRRLWEHTRAFIDQAAGAYHTLATVNFHHYTLYPPNGQASALPWYHYSVDYARNRDMLIAPMAFFNQFWRKRHQVEHTQITWDGHTLRCRICASAPIAGLCQVLPSRHQGLSLKEVLVSGKKRATESRRLQGKDYQMVELDLPNGQTPLEAVYGGC